MIHPREEHGRMTRAMRAVRPTSEDETVNARHALRIAVIEDGVISFERLFGGDVHVGTHPHCDIVLQRGPLRHRLFEHQRGAYRLTPCTETTGKWTAPADRTPRAVGHAHLEMHARGALNIGDTHILFHVLPSPPVRPRAVLPACVERGFLDGTDWMTTVTAAFSFLLHFFAVGLVYSDWLDPVVKDEAVIARLVETSKRVHVPPTLTQPLATATAAGSSQNEAKTSAGTKSPKRAAAGNGASRGQRPSATNASHEDTRAADLGSELDALGLHTIAALNQSGPAAALVLDGGDVPTGDLDAAAASRMGAEEKNGLRLPGANAANDMRPGEHGDKAPRPGQTKKGAEDAETAGDEKVVKGPIFRGGASGGDVSKGGKNIPGATGVVARMRAGFRNCYRGGLSADPTLQGSTSLVASIAANGSVSSVGGGGGALAPIAGCLKSIVRGAQFSAPRDGKGVVSISVNFLIAK